MQISWFGHQVLMPHLYFLYSFWEGSLFSLFLSLFSFFLSQIDLGNTYRKESKNLFPCFSSQNKVNFGVLFVCLFICLFVCIFFGLLFFSVVIFSCFLQFPPHLLHTEKWKYFPWNLYFYADQTVSLTQSKQIVLSVQELHFFITHFTQFSPPLEFWWSCIL